MLFIILRMCLLVVVMLCNCFVCVFFVCLSVLVKNSYCVLVSCNLLLIVVEFCGVDVRNV